MKYYVLGLVVAAFLAGMGFANASINGGALRWAGFAFWTAITVAWVVGIYLLEKD
jgi:hypothetical protein